ncbi:MAG: hypothetical protein A2539_05770 [Elusimicrobia bacterium RIFOXYD2_FULL_34_15]|nr:MAG: hypothetical protein A2539_05770 [Elusimicrobia bacterium RIFOXYD2_FULL_34_15]
MSEELNLIIKQAERWLSKLKDASKDPWNCFEEEQRCFLGFINVIVTNHLLTTELENINKKRIKEERVILIQKIIDEATSESGDYDSIKLANTFFSISIERLDTMSKKLVAYIKHSTSRYDNTYDESVEVAKRSFELRDSLKKIVNKSFDFEDPLTEIVITYIYSKFFLSCPASSYHVLFRNTNQIPVDFNFLIECCESILNYVSQKTEKLKTTSQRQKSEKFGILDSPNLKERDITSAKESILGTSCLYFDIDNFKMLNTEYTESNVDKTVLPEYQNLINSVTESNGYAYAEGGDEVVVLLPNANLDMAISFAKALQSLIQKHLFKISNDKLKLTVSIGISYSGKGEDNSKLIKDANTAMRFVKSNQKNNIAIYVDGRPKFLDSELVQ